MKMKSFQRLWNRIVVLIATATLSLISFGIWIPDKWIKWMIIIIPAVFGVWGVIWEHYRGDKRKLRKDGYGYKQFFSKWYNRPGELVICCGKLSWLVVHKGSKSDSVILDALSLNNGRIAKGSKLKIITADAESEQLKELQKRLCPHDAIEVYLVLEDVIEDFSFSRYTAAGDASQYIIKYNLEDKAGYIIEHTAVSEQAFIDNLITAVCIPTNKI